ncbi:hypothetical protein HDU67_007556 [Dinochytrium kinnereticum]|nr:hypothetical protein HDU67_007556 [Dinochytrium kinnereticum]
MGDYRDTDISRKSRVTASSFDDISVRCRGGICNAEQVKYDLYSTTPGPTRWVSYPRDPVNDVCGEESLLFDWSDKAGTGYKIDMISVLYGDFSFEFDGQKNINSISIFPTLTITPPVPANAPENFTVAPIELARGPDYSPNSFSQNSNYTIFKNVTVDHRFDLFTPNTTNGVSKNLASVAQLKITWKTILPSGFYVPRICQMDVEKVFIAGSANSPIVYQDPTVVPPPPANGGSGGGGLSGGAVAAIILVPMVIIAPLAALFFIRQRNIARRRAAAALRTQRIG